MSKGTILNENYGYEGDYEKLPNGKIYVRVASGKYEFSYDEMITFMLENDYIICEEAIDNKA
jgi:hypothetical protein